MLCVYILQPALQIASIPNFVSLKPSTLQAMRLETNLILNARRYGPPGITNVLSGGDGISLLGSSRVFIYVTFHMRPRSPSPLTKFLNTHARSKRRS